MTWSVWADRERGRDPRRGPLARARATSMPAGRRARWPTARPSCRSRRTTTSVSRSTRRSSRAAHDALDRWGTGAGSARLIVGSRPVHSALEPRSPAGRRTARAALFPTGFAANLGVLTTFGGPDVLVLSDELNHASIIDGCRLSRADVAVFRHGDLDAARSVAGGSRQPPRHRRQRHGVLDGRRRGRRRCPADDRGAASARCWCSTKPTPCSVRIPRSPTTKTSCAWARSRRRSARSAASSPDRRRYVELIENTARPYIFTTAPSPADTAAALAALAVLQSADGDALVARLRAHVDRLRAGHPSPILPFVCGDEHTRAGRVALPSSSRACWCPPSVRRRSRPARRACEWRSPPRTPTSTSADSSPRSRPSSARAARRTM